MVASTLPIALDLLFGDEGGYVNAKTDAGGPTKYGITHKTLAAHRGVSFVSADQVKNMTKQEAEDIYRASYWKQSGGDLLPRGLDYAAFDFGVNSGPATAVKTLQRVVGTTPDGIVGAMTVDAVRKYPGGIGAVISDYIDARMAFLRGLKGKQGWSANGRGWTRRVTGVDPKGVYKKEPGVIGNAVRLAGGVRDVEPSSPSIDSAKAPPSKTGLLSTTEGKALATTGGGLGVGLVSEVVDQLSQYSDLSPTIRWACLGLVAAGLAFGAYRLWKRVRVEGAA